MPAANQNTPDKSGLLSDIAFSFRQRCPVCRKGCLFSAFLEIAETCDHCGAKLGDHDIGDGAVVFFIFLLGFSLIPLTWVLDIKFSLPIWGHVLFVGTAGGVIIFFLMSAVKVYIMLLEFRHLRRPEDK
jgi:uncharacterized protein (DUF983 family)